jgi:hypothetical protein
MAKFYEVKLKGEELDRVIEKCGFSYMKKNTHLFNYQLPLNPDYRGNIMTDGSMTRKGTLGDGKATFTEQGKPIFVQF